MNHLAVWKLFFIMYKNERQLTASSEWRKQLCWVTTYMIGTNLQKRVFLLNAIHHRVSQTSHFKMCRNTEWDVSLGVESSTSHTPQSFSDIEHTDTVGSKITHHITLKILMFEHKITDVLINIFRLNCYLLLFCQQQLVSVELSVAIATTTITVPHRFHFVRSVTK